MNFGGVARVLAGFVAFFTLVQVAPLVLALQEEHVERWSPVQGFGGTVLGIVSMNDLLLAAGPRKAVRHSEVVEALQAICAHHHPTPHIVAA